MSTEIDVKTCIGATYKLLRLLEKLSKPDIVEKIFETDVSEVLYYEYLHLYDLVFNKCRLRESLPHEVISHAEGLKEAFEAHKPGLAQYRASRLLETLREILLKA